MRALLLGLAIGFPFAIPAQPLPGALFDGLSWRMIGPFRGGRAETATGVAGDPNTFYFGAAGGGIWKTIDAGTVWKPIFDAQHIASIGAIEVAPSDPDVIYAGTGETDLRSDIGFGDGVYKSTDAGKTWKNVGLRDSRQIGRILVNPTNPDIVFVAALGHAYGPNDERGVFRSTDGGATWRKVLYEGPDAGAVDLAWAPEDPRTIYATLWNARRPARIQYAPDEGPGSGLYKSTDGGDNWTQIRANGLPEGEWRRAGVAVARGTQGHRVYALIDTKDGGLFRSDDAAKTWVRAGTDPRITARGWYFGRVTVDPKNPDVLYLPNIALYRSGDGGKNFGIMRGAPGGDDYHSLWIDPAEPLRMILATDQGVTISVNGGATWTTWYNQPTAQLYHVITDNQFPYMVYGTQQDSGSVAIPSRTDSGHITDADRHSVGGSESGYIAPDPADPNIVYVAGVYGGLTRFDKRTAQGQNITPWPSFQFNADLQNWKYRYPWTPALVLPPAERNTLYYGSQVLLKSTDGGLKWEEISPDLTGIAKLGVIYSIAPSPLRRGEIWAGTDTGLIHMTRDGGKTWSDVTPRGVTEWSKVTHLEASHFDPGTAYAAIDRHRLDDYRPYLYRTRDYGKNWTAITEGIAEPAFLNAVREDPVRPGLLFAATETGVFVSFDAGDHWQPLHLNLPTCSVRDLAVHGDDLVIATHGRSFWILDDIAPLRQADATVASAGVWLYKPAAAIRTSHEGFLGTPLPLEIPKAANPPDGAIIDYYLATAQDPVTLEVLDSKGQLVRRFSSTEQPRALESARAIADAWLTVAPRLTGRAGMNRFVWDLRYAAPGRAGPQVLPNKYEVKLTIAGQVYRQTLEVVLDPRSSATSTDLESQLDLGLKAVRAIEHVAEATAQVRAARARLNNMKLDAASNPSAPEVLSTIGSVDPELEQILNGLLKTNRDLGAALEVAESADRQPPAQDWDLLAEANQELSVNVSRWNAVKAKFPK
jgi:photosystem II stability/assembly factor-like uncharacterized protein